MHTRQDQTSRHPRHGEEFQIPQPTVLPVMAQMISRTKTAGFLEKRPACSPFCLALPYPETRHSLAFQPRERPWGPRGDRAGKGIPDAGCSDSTDQEIEARRGEGHPGRVSPMGRTGLLGVAWAVTGALFS